MGEQCLLKRLNPLSPCFCFWGRLDFLGMTGCVKCRSSGKIRHEKGEAQPVSFVCCQDAGQTIGIAHCA